MKQQTRMMSKKSLGKPSKEAKRLENRMRQMDNELQPSNAEMVKAWNNRNWELRMVDMNLDSALVALALRPWAWRNVSLKRVEAKTKTLKWKCTTDASLRALLPDTWKDPNGWTLSMEERTGNVRQLVLSRSKSLRRNSQKLQKAWDDMWRNK